MTTRIELTGRITAVTPESPKRRILCSAPDCPNEVAAINTLCIGHRTDEVEKATTIMRKICSEQKVSVAEVCGPRKDAYIVACRWKIVVSIRNGTILSWSQIGKIINKKHSSVIYMFNMAMGVKRDPSKKGKNVPFLKTVIVDVEKMENKK